MAVIRGGSNDVKIKFILTTLRLQKMHHTFQLPNQEVFYKLITSKKEYVLLVL